MDMRKKSMFLVTVGLMLLGWQANSVWAANPWPPALAAMESAPNPFEVTVDGPNNEKWTMYYQDEKLHLRRVANDGKQFIYHQVQRLDIENPEQEGAGRRDDSSDFNYLTLMAFSWEENTNPIDWPDYNAVITSGLEVEENKLYFKGVLEIVKGWGKTEVTNRSLYLLGTDATLRFPFRWELQLEPAQ